MITIYTKNTCAYCIAAKKLMEEKNMQFIEINIEEDQDARDFLISNGHSTVPQLYEGNKLFVEGGFVGLQNYLNERDEHVN